MPNVDVEPGVEAERPGLAIVGRGCGVAVVVLLVPPVISFEVTSRPLALKDASRSSSKLCNENSGLLLMLSIVSVEVLPPNTDWVEEEEEAVGMDVDIGIEDSPEMLGGGCIRPARYAWYRSCSKLKLA
jgi:hypothetical protein